MQAEKKKTLWTDLEDGKKIIWYKAVDETDESRFVAEKIEKEVQNGASYQDFAVLYRMNAQSNNIERMFVKEKSRIISMAAHDSMTEKKSKMFWHT